MSQRSVCSCHVGGCPGSGVRFAALETPDLLVADIREFFTSLPA